ncbi:SRPBCC family protein [Rhabdothermincola sediminis]|uniref:SRPBCC family protein n=1 Tax=Rhabdothermincola sediminis TaxID=2751370 RepID=UPI001AA08783|nr:SRPBCC domain-containing protein [Rhabdothermincola sediminis]
MHSIVHELTIAAPPERVFRALTDTTELGRWWGGSITGEVREGGDLRCKGDRPLHLRIDTLDAPELVHFDVLDGPEEWTGTQIAIRVEPDPEGSASVVRFWHGGWEYDDGSLPRVSFGWALDLEALRRSIEG